MMRVFIIALLAGLASPVHAEGNANLRVVLYGTPTPPVVSNCPYLIDNGCSTSIPGQPGSTAVMYGRAPGGMLNQLTGSTTDESQNPNNINEPGVDYPVGEWKALSELKDPLDPAVGIVATNPSGVCTYDPAGGVNSGPQMNCDITTAGQNIDIEDYDMSRGGTTCIPISAGTGTAGTKVTIKDNYWLNNGHCAVTFGGNSKQAMLFLVGQKGRVEVAFNTMDAQPTVWPFPFGSCSPPGSWQDSNTTCNATIPFIGQGSLWLHHNYFKRFRGDVFQYFANGVTPFGEELVQNNLVEGCCAITPDDHGEFQGFLGPAGSSAQQALGYRIIGNTIISTTDHMNNGNAAFPDQLHSMSLMTEYVLADNLYIAGTTGGASRQVNVFGKASGSMFTTNSISAVPPEQVGTFGSGSKIQCNPPGHPADILYLMSVYNGGAGTVAAAGGGGHSIAGNRVSNWAMTMFGAPKMTAGLSNGSRAAGNIMNVTIPTVTITIGTRVFIGNASRSVTAFGSGTGGAGTYTVDGAAALQAVGDGVQLGQPANVFPGGWTISGTLNCAGTGFGPAGAQRAYSFTRAFAMIAADTPGGPRAGTQVTRNTLDLYAYGPKADQAINVASNNPPVTFNGTIIGNQLTVNSGSGVGVGNNLAGGLLMATGNGIVRGTYITGGTSPTFTLSKTYATQVGPETMQAAITICIDHPTIFGNNIAIDKVYPGYPNLNAWGKDPASPGDGC